MENYDLNQRPVIVDNSRAEITNAFMRRVYQWMAIGLALTAVAAYMASTSVAFMSWLYTNQWAYIGLLIAEFGLVMVINFAINKISAGTASGLFLLYSALSGVTLGPIVAMYTSSSVALAFATSGGMFAAMSIYGLLTKRDLTSLGSFMHMGLIGIIIAMVVNFFVGSGTMDMIISVLGVFIFLGLTAYDTQKLLQRGATAPMNEHGVVQRGVILGALELYLDFINMFLFLLRLFGDRD